MSIRSEYNIVESFLLSDTISYGLPKAIVALYYRMAKLNSSGLFLSKNLLKQTPEILHQEDGNLELAFYQSQRV
ncbi:hypothetical protein BOTNAR_0036g00170 [Botryotinia narcissicola]|uniref:Uncharacterized protein n=1 Tax=Botryotinia narcissicola TaxID=278944 RepID=A0A4Z1J2D9_9HELO|nr:hypothetical protein BOTNAR_0036g00170 [Botryotinia narcissicola]